MSCCSTKSLSGVDQSSGTVSGTFTADAFSTGGPPFTYTEGSLTLTISTPGGATNMSIDVQESYYTKIGNHVIVNFAMSLLISDNTTPGTVTLSGFPIGPALSYGSCTLAQAFPTIAPDITSPVQGFMLNGDMTFYPISSSSPIQSDLLQDGKTLIGNISYNYSQPDL